MEKSGTFKGATCVVCAMAILGLVDNFFVIAAQDTGLWQFHAMRTALMLPVFLLISRVAGVSLWPRNARRAFLRTLLLAVGMVIYFTCLGILPIAQVGSGLFTSPMWILIFSVVLFGERIGLFRVAAMVAGFAGVLLILKPAPQDVSFISLMPILSGAFYGLSMLLTRRFCAGEEALCLTAWSFLMLGGIGLIALIFFTLFPHETDSAGLAFVTSGWIAPTSSLWGVLALQVAGSIGAVFLLTRAYQIGDASCIAVFEYSFLIFATAWSWVLWRQETDAVALSGIAIIIVSGIVIFVRTRRSETNRDPATAG